MQKIINYLEENKNINMIIIFNIYKDIDEIIYKKILIEKIENIKIKFNNEEI